MMFGEKKLTKSAKMPLIPFFLIHPEYDKNLFPLVQTCDILTTFSCYICF